jgi:hypothetical protein
MEPKESELRPNGVLRSSPPGINYEQQQKIRHMAYTYSIKLLVQWLLGTGRQYGRALSRKGQGRRG